MSKDTREQPGRPGGARLLAATGLAASLLTGVALSAQAAGTNDSSASGEQSASGGQMQSSQNTQSSQSMQSSQDSQSTQSMQNQTLDQLAQQEGQVSEFIKALEQTGMANALTGGNKYTIFAPTNDAFQSSGQDIQRLMQPGHQQELVNLLRAHIVADDVDPQMAQRIGKAKTIGGGTVDLSSKNGTLQVGDAKVVASNIQQGNLRLYAIDSVLPAGAPMTASTADFDQLDSNGDGYLSQDELQGNQTLASHKDEIDTNSDGRINRSEFSAFEQSRGSESGGSQSGSMQNDSMQNDSMQNDSSQSGSMQQSGSSSSDQDETSSQPQ